MAETMKLALLVAAFVLTSPANPVYNRDFPDPFVLKVGHTYFAYATNGNGSNVQTATSTDLVHWTPGRDALPKLGSWDFPATRGRPRSLRTRTGPSF